MPSPIQNPRLLLSHLFLALHFPPNSCRLLQCSTTVFSPQPAPASQTLARAMPPSFEILSICESLLSHRRMVVGITAEYLDHLRLTEPQLRSFLHVSETAMREAEEVNRLVERGVELGPLTGVLVAVKDNICTADMPSTGGSRILSSYRPAFDATAVRRLREAEAIIVGKTNLDEFGMGSTTESSGFQVSLTSFSLGLPAYYVLASSEASSNLSRYDGVRYGYQATTDELSSLYGDSRANGFGPEVKLRILMGTYALSTGYYDAYYKRAQQVRMLVRKSFKDALHKNDILISPAAPSAAYKIGEKTNDPLAMYASDIMTVVLFK